MKMRSLLACLSLAISIAAPAFSATDMETGVKELAQQISADMGDAEIDRIAIVEFGDLSGEITELGQFLAEELTTQLFIVSPGRFQVVERRQLMRVLEEQQLSVTGLLDDDALENIGRILGIQALVTGSITDLGNEVKINARLIAIDTARIFAVASTRFPKVGTVADLISRKIELPRQVSPKTNGGLISGQGDTRQLAREFSNEFLTARVKGFTVDSDKRRATLALALRNTSSQPLRIAFKTRGNWDGASLSDNVGSLITPDRVRGIPFISARMSSHKNREDKYALISPGSMSTVFFEFRSDRIAGSQFAFSSEFYRLHSTGGWSQFSVDISGINLQAH